MRIFFLILSGSTPVEIANSSPPIDSAFKSQDHFNAVGNRAIRINAMNATFFVFGLERLPNDQWASWDSCASEAKYCIVDTIAPHMKVIAIPTNIYDSAEIDLILPNCMIIATTIKENMKEFATIANAGTDNIVNPNTMARAAPSAAPEATPKVRGETKGFPKQPCIKEPATANAMPPTMAASILGSLQS